MSLNGEQVLDCGTTVKLPPVDSLMAATLTHQERRHLNCQQLCFLLHILMIPPTGNCYQVQCTTGVTVTDTNYLQSVVLPGGSSSNLIYNDLYLIVCLRMLLLLSGDVELNPGPIIDDRPDISLLTQWLEPLVDWQLFGYCLPGITQHDVLKIEAESSSVDDQKRKLYSKWLSVSPEASWNDVITALKIRRENTLAQNIKEMIEGHPSVPNDSNATAVGSTQREEIMFNTQEDETEVSHSLIELNKSFTSLMTKVRTAFDEKEASDPTLLVNLRRWIETYMNWTDKLTDASLNETFNIIHPFYDFIDCNLIVDLSEEFLNGVTFGEGNEMNIVSELKNHRTKVNTFRSSINVAHLHKSLIEIYQEHIPNLTNMPHIVIKLHNPWYRSSLSNLKLLIEHLLPEGFVQSLLKHITIFKGCIVIKLQIVNFTADSLIEYTGGKLQFIRLIGIFSLYINNHPVLQEDENMNFTFELALLEAVTAGNNEAVEFLLQLETVNIDHTNEEGKTALMLACERGHEDIVDSLVSAGANVNIQDNKGLTALMIASAFNHISIIHMLLHANANPHLKKSNGSNALMIASYNGNHEVVELLMKGVDYKYQQEDGANAFMVACQNGHTQIVELLLKEQVDPNVQKNNGWNAFMLASQYGHTQIVELLLKEKVDPNVQDKDGWNAFMLACLNGHTQIVELLLKEKVDPNVRRNSGGNAFMSACRNGHTQIVKLLLKEQVDPNVQKNDGWNAFMLASQYGHTQIVELLLKEKVDPNVQDKDGWNAFMLASQYGHTQIVELLLKEKVDPNVRRNSGGNAFMSACRNGHTQIVKLLLKEQVDPNVQKNDGWNAFMLASQYGHTQIVELLPKEKVDPNVQDKDGWNAFMLACQNGHIQIVELLLKEQVDPNVQKEDGSVKEDSEDETFKTGLNRAEPG
uniref:Death domain-containing protein n=1 Tax=Amphimedon queenslandica TaxID=400682 RepID=A0A1X7TCJ4_AMPQE